MIRNETLQSEEKVKNIAKVFDIVRKFELVAREAPARPFHDPWIC